jgi:hypothetical protein
MASVPPKKMLEAILKAKIPAKDRETFEGMWDAVHRYGGLSKRQVSWIEDVFYKLPKPDPAVARTRTVRKASVNSTSVKEAKNVRTFEQFKALCPNATPTVTARVEKFFKEGGELLRVLPMGAAA